MEQCLHFLRICVISDSLLFFKIVDYKGQCTKEKKKEKNLTLDQPPFLFVAALSEGSSGVIQPGLPNSFRMNLAI